MQNMGDMDDYSRDYRQPQGGAPMGQNIRPMVDPSAEGEVDPTKLDCDLSYIINPNTEPFFK